MRGDDQTVLDPDRSAPGRTRAEARPPFGPRPIAKGDRLLDIYEVLDGPLPGAGMSRVFQVRHLGYNIDLAMKQPHPGSFDTEEERADFRRECETWIQLGYHPNVVTCHYVRDIDGLPSIFSEWMAGGSLKRLIDDGGLYTRRPLRESWEMASKRPGAIEDPLSSILEVAIRAAYGLAYAHGQGLIHRDVKPSNILLAASGETRIADFGLAMGHKHAAAGGGTPAYYSPEQLRRQGLDAQTDVYSFGVTLLEMFLGECPWAFGPVAGLGLEKYLKMDLRTPMPKSIQDLLRACLRQDPAQRPPGFESVIRSLTNAYRDQNGLPRFIRFSHKTRALAAPAAETADSLNNRALSYLDLGRPDEAERCWGEALARSPGHSEALFNSLLHRVKTGRMTALSAADAFVAANRDSRKAHLEYQLRAEEGRLRLFEIQDEGICRLSGRRPEAPAPDRGRSPDGRYFLRTWPGGINGRVDAFEARTGETVNTFKGCVQLSGRASCFTPDGRVILGENEADWILAAPDGSDVVRFIGHGVSDSPFIWYPKWRHKHDLAFPEDHAVYYALVSRDGRLALSAGADFTVRLWDAETGELLRTYRNPAPDRPNDWTGVMALAGFLEEDQAVFALQGTDTFLVWDRETGQLLASGRAPFWYSENPPEAWGTNPPFVLARRRRPASYLLCAAQTTDELLDHDDRFAKRLKAAKLFYQDGNLRRAREEIEKCLAVPTYEQDPRAIRLLQAICAGRPKTGLALMRPTPPDPGANEAEDAPAPAETVPAAWGALQEKAAAMVKKSLPERGSDCEWSGYLLEAAPSLDGKRAVFKTLVQKKCDNFLRGRQEDMFWYGALAFDLESKELVGAFDRLYTKWSDAPNKVHVSVSLDAGGRRLLLAADRLAVIDVASGRERVIVPDNNILWARFFSDDRLIFYFTEDGAAAVVDSETGTEWGRVSWAGKSVASAALVDDNSFRVTYKDGRLETWLLYWQYEAEEEEK